MAARDDTPSIHEIAELAARLRALSAAGRYADPAERVAFLADKDALLDRIENADRERVEDATQEAEPAHEDQDDDAVMARAVAGGYAMVGPSARTWSVDTTTGIPVGPVAEAEHRRVRDLIAREHLDGAEPVWLRCADGGAEIVAAVVPSRIDAADPVHDRAAEDERNGGPSRAAVTRDALTGPNPSAQRSHTGSAPSRRSRAMRSRTRRCSASATGPTGIPVVVSTDHVRADGPTIA